MWLFYCMCSTIASGFLSVFLRKSKGSDGVASTLISNITYNTMFVIIGISRGYLKTFDPAMFIMAFPVFAFHITGFVANVLCARYARITVVTPVKRVRSIMPLILSYFFLHERLTAAQLIASFSLVGLTVISTMIDKKDNGGKFEKQEILGIILALVFSVCNAISSFLTKIYVVKLQDPFLLSFYTAILSITTMLTYAAFTGNLKKIDYKYIDGKWWFIGYMACEFLTALFNRLGYVDGPISIMYVLQSSAIVITTICSKVILGEKISFKKYVSIAAIFICSIALSFVA